MTTLSHQQQPVPQNTPPSSSNGQPQKGGKFASWTGFSGKTLWDWLQLLAVLAVPLAVAFGTTYFAYQQTQLSDVQHQHEVDAANLQHQRDVDAANLQHQETILKSYQDDLKDLMLTRGLITSKPDDEVRAIALTEVLSALRQLDSRRNRVFIEFLLDARLIGQGGNGSKKLYDDVITFNRADLTGDSLEGVILRDVELFHSYLGNANLGNANLIGADLGDATLSYANLSYAYLSGANLRNANLGNANLIGANLERTDLSYADLTGAHLNNADLSGANLTNDILTQDQVNLAITCKDTITPKGITHSQVPCKAFQF